MHTNVSEHDIKKHECRTLACVRYHDTNSAHRSKTLRSNCNIHQYTPRHPMVVPCKENDLTLCMKCRVWCHALHRNHECKHSLVFCRFCVLLHDNQSYACNSFPVISSCISLPFDDFLTVSCKLCKVHGERGNII